MSKIQDAQKTLEVKIRPFANQNFKDRPDQNGVSRVYLSSTALSELNLKPGMLCHIWKKDELEHEKKEAIAWLTTEKSTNKKVIYMSKTFQDVCDFKLADDLLISGAGVLGIAGSIFLRDITQQESADTLDIEDEDRPHWEWFLRENLGRAEVIFPGMVLKNISLRGPKRDFIVDFINGKPAGLGKYDSTTAVKISSRIEAPAQYEVSRPSARLEVVDIAGIDQALKKLNRFLTNFDRQFKFTWAQRSCAVLLHGGHGTGKTYLLNKILNTGWSNNVLRLDGDAKISNVRSTFRDAKLSQPSIIVIDDLESLVSKEDVMSISMAKAFGEELDILAQSHSGSSLPRVLVIATALNSSNIPISLKKRGRFRTEISLPIPDVAARKAILKSLEPPIHPDTREETLNKLGDRTHAYTAEDLVALLDAACELAEEKAETVREENEQGFYLAQEDIEQALLLVRPTAMHDITLQPPSVRWDEIGGQDSVKNALRRAVETPLLNPERMKRVGASPKKGLLLYGPPGCSKTLSAQAMATEVGFNFFAVKGAELLNMYVGESERAVRDVFARARAASPSIIFFDEIESIGSKRSGRNNGVNVLTTLLNEMDGIETLKGVTVLAATNQPQALDLALLRPGRFDKLLYVAPPDLEGRKEILRVRKRTMDMADDVDISRLAELTDGYSGAELVGICQTACDDVMEKCEKTGEELQVHMDDFLNAIKLVKKQITPKLIEGYEKWAAGARGDTD
ncbi:AAA+-type ATPase [Cadophora gregata]|uniref:AAA+-type ATPase n=1 Tax=Cadophora gregata TaxID=51156 RepID=UPI0026DC0D78|nr:AAA+-type ATPase [Cadophora gregata]KAK0111390.1 AAA+-type ATPase [Cadophora gregata]KAK0112133.1 AAA+-type ATPase [Cadophora gregata f. sp. sojae]